MASLLSSLNIATSSGRHRKVVLSTLVAHGDKPDGYSYQREARLSPSDTLTINSKSLMVIRVDRSINAELTLEPRQPAPPAAEVLPVTVPIVIKGLFVYEGEATLLLRNDETNTLPVIVSALTA